MEALIVVPTAGLEDSSKVPPTNSARSLIDRTPPPVYPSILLDEASPVVLDVAQDLF
jgi:hypothetical protein